jgi:hypothetical protein
MRGADRRRKRVLTLPVQARRLATFVGEGVVIKNLQEHLSTADHLNSLMLRGPHDAYLERCTINGAAR